jgi:hypothetical protein
MSPPANEQSLELPVDSPSRGKLELVASMA